MSSSISTARERAGKGSLYAMNQYHDSVIPRYCACLYCPRIETTSGGQTTRMASGHGLSLQIRMITYTCALRCPDHSAVVERVNTMADRPAMTTRWVPQRGGSNGIQPRQPQHLSPVAFSWGYILSPVGSLTVSPFLYRTEHL